MKKLIILLLVIPAVFYSCKEDKNITKIIFDKDTVEVYGRSYGIDLSACHKGSYGHEDTLTGISYINVNLKLDTVIFKPTVPKSDSSLRIVVSSALISYAPPFGYVGRGSGLFTVNDQMEGYSVEGKIGDKAVMTSFCPKSELKKYIHLTRYACLKNDSVISITK